ncbi:MAG TPA: class III extradiol ring-cleavage dioxygenase [Steroidobacter sp.]
MGIAPALFISHGAPTFAVEPGQLGARLSAIRPRLEAVKALLVVSPHWRTERLTFMTTLAPETLHDFSGFPEPLYQLQHPAPGHPEVALEIANDFALSGWPVQLDSRRGLDHGAWVPLRYLDPKAEIPTFQVSLPHGLDPVRALRLGRELAPWRRQGVAIIGSGSLTHNLYELRWNESDEDSYAREFTQWVRDVILKRDLDRLVRYRELAPHARRAHPTEEHFLPLLIAAGASCENESIEVLEGGMTYGVLSMESYGWGVQHPLCRERPIAADAGEERAPAGQLT